MPDGWVFGALFRMFLYHWEHPFQYISIVSFSFACVATPCTHKFKFSTGWKLQLITFAIIVSSVIFASVPGGILWSIHDMQAGYFPKGEKFWEAIWWGATNGLTQGWLVIALSIPYNLICLIIGFFITRHGFRMAKKSYTK